MNREISAGGIIVYRSGAGWLVLVMKDKSGNWTFPKGKIESGEKQQTAAVREISEEVGLTGLTFIAELAPVQYWYLRGIPIKKTVQYYLFQSRTKQKPTVQTEEGITEAKWILLKDAQNSIGYPKTNTKLLVEVSKKLHIL